MSADVPCVIFFLCSNCVIFGAFRTTLDVVVVQPFWFEQGMFAVLKLCLFRTECILTIIMGRTWFVDVPTILYKIRNYLDHPHVSRFLTIVRHLQTSSTTRFIIFACGLQEATFLPWFEIYYCL
jgi:hypothetical protein